MQPLLQIGKGQMLGFGYQLNFDAKASKFLYCQADHKSALTAKSVSYRLEFHFNAAKGYIVVGQTVAENAPNFAPSGKDRWA